ncbi:hypothetical protein [Thauera sinica]|uniref:Uncharacterized protein n=1 Tax=Thauera sinica TaxID=2665146 RepID=A0ABW1AXP2_9RHOO|nr:hypothetical protein [Thauera sp. K11]
MHAPTDVHELLSLLACELDTALTRLQPAMPVADREHLAIELMHACRLTVGGHRLPAFPSLAASELLADVAYSKLYDGLRAVLDTHITMPSAWLDVATLQLLDTVRETAKGEYIPKTRYIAAERNLDEMWRNFRGDFRATGLEYHLSSERIRQLMRPLMAADLKSRQGNLFPDEQP